MTVGGGGDVGGNDDDETTLFPPRTVGVSNYIQLMKQLGFHPELLFPSCFMCGYTSNAARGKRLQGRSLFLNQGLIMASS